MIARRYPALMQEPPGSGDVVERWAASGAMALTGLPEEPLGPPAGLVEGVERLGARFAGLDALALLGERAAHMGLWRRGPVSCGGSCHLLPCADGWLAVSLPRDEDMELVPAWLGLEPDGGKGTLTPPAAWQAVGRALAGRSAAEVSDLLGRARGCSGCRWRPWARCMGPERRTLASSTGPARLVSCAPLSEP